MQPLPETASERRYAPPGAEVADVAAGTQPVRLWPPHGRIGRLRFFVWGIGAWLAATIFGALFGLAAGIGGARPEFASVVSLVVYVVVIALIAVQRSHDMNLSGWASLLLIVPFVGLFWLFKGGTPGANRFGLPPPPNTTSLVVVAWIVGGLMALIFVAIVAAVAIPAYAVYGR